MSNKRLVVDTGQCTGCISCVLTCSAVHEGVFSPTMARIRIDREGEQAVSKPRVCVQCDQAPCIDSCPVGALSRAETGVIRVDQESCTACEACGPACPYGGISFAPETRVPLICDLCGGGPECVQFCRLARAIRFE